MNQLRRHRNRKLRIDRIVLVAILIGAIVCLVILISGKLKSNKKHEANNSDNGIVDIDNTAAPVPDDDTQPSDTENTPEPTPFRPTLNVHSVQGTTPEDFNMTTDLTVNGEKVTSYTADEPFNFGLGSEYTDIEGVISFRGNNFRNGGSYGRIGVLDIEYDAQGIPVRGRNLEEVWNVPTGGMQKGISKGYSGSWTGSGWTGQPILVKWDRETKEHMNMFDWAKEDDELVEVIYATMDGNIYFLDLQTGNATRKKLNINLPFKGAGSLDPRGYPILYLGAGDSYDKYGRPAKAMAVNLLDCTILYEFGHRPDSFAIRDWTAYDSSALICEENDCLVYPGENGILYVMKLNTQYDKEAGTLSMNPSNVVKFRYSTPRNRDKGFAVGYEGSAAAYSHYVYLTENSGIMHCIDLNTMEVMWVQSTNDDTNCSPVFSIEGEKCYLYIGNTVDSTSHNGKGEATFYKIDAETGEVIWSVSREVYTSADITGGIMSCAVVGREKLEGRVFFIFEGYNPTYGSTSALMCVDRENGETIWEGTLRTYSWSSPVCVYDEDGNGYLVAPNCGGNIYLIDGGADTYEKCIIDRFDIREGTIEASPAVFDNMIVIGTRVSGIYGIRIK